MEEKKFKRNSFEDELIKRFYNQETDIQSKNENNNNNDEDSKSN